MDEYSIILLSNSSTNFYKNNKLSEFTNNLNPPLNLSPLGKWKVALTEIQHNNLLDYIYAPPEKDKIVFEESLANEVEIFTLKRLANMMWFYATTPEMYNYTYFHDFLDIKKLETFPDEKSFKEYDITKEEEASKNLTFNITVQLTEFPNIPEKIIKFKTSYEYTGKQIVYRVVQTIFEMLRGVKDLYSVFPFLISKGHALHIIVSHFIDLMRYGTNLMKKNRNHHFESLGSFVYIYSDIIENGHVGDQYHKILSMLPVKEIEQEYTIIKNVQYVPVNVEQISQISIKLADENSNPLPLEGGYNPTMVKLHFKKIV
jgi:hypothetical protein